MLVAAHHHIEHQYGSGDSVSCGAGRRRHQIEFVCDVFYVLDAADGREIRIGRVELVKVLLYVPPQYVMPQEVYLQAKWKEAAEAWLLGELRADVEHEGDLADAIYRAEGIL